MIRNAQSRDADVLARLYNHYVINTVATFEELPVTAIAMKGRLNAVGLPWLMLERDGYWQRLFTPEKTEVEE
jgi:phosphinothricin acetyltransferase